MLISDEYRKLNEELHKSNPSYGTSGSKHAEMVKMVATGSGIKDILDYGCGKCTLSNALPQFNWSLYDPCIPHFSERPDPHDMVTCTDVLEHIEPESLSYVLADLARVTRGILYLDVALRPAKKTLSDGRNAHLIVQPVNWWLKRLYEHGLEVLNLQHSPGAAFMGVFRRMSND